MKTLGMVRVVVVLVACVVAGGCPMSTAGTEHMLLFSPLDCGWGVHSCTFTGTGVAVGTDLDMEIMNIGSMTARTDLTLESSDQMVLMASSSPSAAGDFALKGLKQGTVTLSAKAGNSVIDEIDVDVKVAMKLGLAVGPNSQATVNMNDPAFNEVWTMPVNVPVFFQVVPKSSTNLPLMGRLGMQYSRTASPLDKGAAGPTDGTLLVPAQQNPTSGEIMYTVAQASPLPSPLSVHAKIQVQ